MTPREMILSAGKQLQSAGIEAGVNDCALLLSRILGRPPLSLRLDDETLLSEQNAQSFLALFQRRLHREPLQYILGDAVFCGRTFLVDSRVLIPRPETELLCLWVLEIPLPDSLRVLDLCCGSGCIGLTLLAERPGWSVVLSDFSREALSVAGENALRLSLSPRLVESDLFACMQEDLFDLIVSNPPYIPTQTCATLQPEVLREPAIALNGGADGLDFYRRICLEAPAHLVHGGRLMLEIGAGEREAVQSMLEEAGFTAIQVRPDWNGFERMILALWP